MEKLIEPNIRFVVSVAAQYQDKGLSLEELPFAHDAAKLHIIRYTSFRMQKILPDALCRKHQEGFQRNTVFFCAV